MGNIYRKNCDKCHRPSFSSSEIGSWYCPICHNDLTTNPFFDANTFEQIHTNFLVRKVINGYENMDGNKEDDRENDKK